MSEKLQSTMTFSELNEMLSTDMGILGLEATDPNTDTARRNVVISAMAVAGEIAAEENPYLNVVPFPVKTKATAIAPPGFVEGKIIDKLTGMDKRQLMMVLRDTAYSYRKDHPNGANISEYVAKSIGGILINGRYFFPQSNSTD